MSGLKINFLKSEVMMVLHDDDKKLIYADIFWCQLGNWPIKYLVVPVCGLMTHKYRGLQQSSREVKPKFIDSTQGEPKNIYMP
jgi:hypothetical protein